MFNTHSSLNRSNESKTLNQTDEGWNEGNASDCKIPFRYIESPWNARTSTSRTPHSPLLGGERGAPSTTQNTRHCFEDNYKFQAFNNGNFRGVA